VALALALALWPTRERNKLLLLLLLTFNFHNEKKRTTSKTCIPMITKKHVKMTRVMMTMNPALSAFDRITHCRRRRRRRRRHPHHPPHHHHHHYRHRHHLLRHQHPVDHHMDLLTVARKSTALELTQHTTVTTFDSCLWRTGSENGTVNTWVCRRLTSTRLRYQCDSHSESDWEVQVSQ
jgi:hypothetical protein